MNDKSKRVIFVGKARERRVGFEGLQVGDEFVFEDIREVLISADLIDSSVPFGTVDLPRNHRVRVVSAPTLLADGTRELVGDFYMERG